VFLVSFEVCVDCVYADSCGVGFGSLVFLGFIPVAFLCRVGLLSSFRCLVGSDLVWPLLVVLLLLVRCVGLGVFCLDVWRLVPVSSSFLKI